MKNEITKIINLCNSSPLFYLVVFTTFLFVLRIPITDLPVWDDSITYHYGWQLRTGHFHILNIQWSPLLVFLCAGFDFLFAWEPIVGFFMFRWLAHLLLAAGTYSLLVAFNASKSWSALLSGVWCFLVHSLCVFAFLPPLHIYHCAIPLLLCAYAFRASPVDPIVLLMNVFLVVLVRNEAVLLVGCFTVAGWYRRRVRMREQWKWTPALSLPLGLLLLSLFLSMSFHDTNWKLGRFEQAFRQQFYDYARQYELFGASLPATPTKIANVMEEAFGENALHCNLFQLTLRRPELIVGVMINNIDRFMKGKILNGMYQHQIFGRILFFLYGISCLSLLLMAIWKRNLVLFMLFLGMTAKLPLQLFTVPRIRYSADVFFIATLGIWNYAIPN